MATATTPTKPAADSAPNDNGWKPELHDVALDAIELGGNVRSPDALDVKELAASIAANGVRSPIRVADIGAGRYELIYGQRRVAAARLAGLVTIPAVVDAEQPAREDRAVDQLLENLQREDLNALDTAKAYRWLLDKGLTQRALGERLGIAQPTIANTLALLRAPDEIQARVAAGELTRSHVEAIVKLPKAEQAEVARRAVEHGLSTRQVEEEISLAASRQTDEERRRERAKNAAATRLATVIDLLVKKKADPEKVTLVGWAGTSGDVLEQLKALGWKGKLGDGVTPAKGICDCTALRLEFRYEWPGGQQVEKASLIKACISSKHQDAARKADREAFDAQQAEQREVERGAAEERAAALAPLAAAVTTAMPPAKAKLVLFVVLGGGHDNGYWDANRWVHARNDGEGLAYGHWQDHLWAAIDGLGHGQLLTEIAQVVAAAAVDAGGNVRAAIDALVAGDGSKPATKARAKKA